MFTNLRLSVNQCASHLDKHLLNINIESLRHSRSKLWITAKEMTKLTVNDRILLWPRYPAHRLNDVGNQVVPVIIVYCFVKQLSRLGVMIVITRRIAVIPVRYITLKLNRRLLVGFVHIDIIEAIWK